MTLHSLLGRQLDGLHIDPRQPPKLEQWGELLACISRAYDDADQDRYTLERSIVVSGAETRELYAALARDHTTLLKKGNRIQASFDHSAIGQAMIDESGLLTAANNAFAEMMGYPTAELVGRELLSLSDAPQRAQFTAPLRELLLGERRELAAEQHWHTKEGTGLWVNLTLSLVESSGPEPRFAALFVENVTERKRLEVDLRHAQKLESVGRLAAGIAHEINTPVQFVSDNLPFLEDAAEANRRLRLRFRELLSRAVAAGCVQIDEVVEAERTTDVEYFDQELPLALAQTREGLQRVATIVRAMKDFAHPDNGKQSKADLNRALASTITVARSEFSRFAEVQTEFGDIPLVLCNLGDLNQAFLNILVNAAHAIADVVGTSGRLGTIRVRTAREGDVVVITISDTGGGIPEHIRAHVFEPFFTTKEVGRGTGQGLAMARSVIADRHRGQLTFRSQVGEGTMFEIRLPIEQRMIEDDMSYTT
jgi:PAS domain S-box-containing protein